MTNNAVPRAVVVFPWHQICLFVAFVFAVVVLVAWAINVSLPPRIQVWEWLVAVLVILGLMLP